MCPAPPPQYRSNPLGTRTAPRPGYPLYLPYTPLIPPLYPPILPLYSTSQPPCHSLLLAESTILKRFGFRCSTVSSIRFWHCTAPRPPPPTPSQLRHLNSSFSSNTLSTSELMQKTKHSQVNIILCHYLESSLIS